MQKKRKPAQQQKGMPMRWMEQIEKTVCFRRALVNSAPA